MGGFLLSFLTLLDVLIATSSVLRDIVPLHIVSCCPLKTISFPKQSLSSDFLCAAQEWILMRMRAGKAFVNGEVSALKCGGTP